MRSATASRNRASSEAIASVSFPGKRMPNAVLHYRPWPTSTDGAEEIPDVRSPNDRLSTWAGSSLDIPR